MLQIRRKFSSDDFERGLAAIHQERAGDLWLPNTINHGVLGGEAALIQLVASWARAYDGGTLVVHAADSMDPAFKAFASTPFGLAALNVAPRIRTRSGLAVARGEALELSRDFVQAMHDGALTGLRVGAAVHFMCVDNARHLGRPRRLYAPDTESVRGPGGFVDLVTAVLGAIVPSGRRRTLALKDFSEPLGSLAYELFSNTHDHARHDLVGDQYPRSVRGLTLRYHYVRRQAFPELAGNQCPLEAYFADWRPDIPNAQHAQFVELSVFDTGAGMADTWLARARGYLPDKVREANVDETYEAVLACMQKNATTKDNKHRGNGLYRVVRILKRYAGLLRVRSGRMGLVKAFTPDGALEPLDDNDLLLVDAQTGQRPNTLRRRAAGTVTTVLLPLNTGTLT